jgi:hypothetical protein
VPPAASPGPQKDPQQGQQSNQPEGQRPGQPAAGYPQPLPWQPYPAPGAPAYPGGYPGGYPGAYPSPDADPYSGRSGYSPYSQTQGSAGQPSLEVSLRETRPYAQQPVLLQLDVLSFGNLATASPELSGFEAILLEEVSGPATSVRGAGRDRQIVNSYLLALTPLRDGPLEIGPFKVSGTLAGGVPFTATAPSSIRLDVRPLVASVRPWLPLRALELTRDLDEAKPLAEGRPTTLTLRMHATGGTGEQLPDLESMLVSEDFRAYREQTIVETGLSEDGRTLEGIRTEVYTLVPYSGGRLQLPEIRVNWWNIETARRESSSVPIRSLSVVGETGPFGFGRGASGVGREGSGWSWFWIPVGGIGLLLIGYWAGVWYRLSWPRAPAVAAGAGTEGPQHQRSRLGKPLRGASNQLGSRLRTGLETLARRLNPRAPIARLMRWLRSRAAALVPLSVRVYRCASDADSAQTPSEWAMRFQSSACQSLRTPGREPLPRVADRILRLRPGADAERVRRLIQELDNALYNRPLDSGNPDTGTGLDMQRWKRELRQALRPGWGVLRGLFGHRVRRGRLPALNPGAEAP